MSGEAVISGVVEGIVDESVFCRLVRHAGAIPGKVYGKKGKQDILQKIGAYNKAAEHSPWIVVVDLDDAAGCAPALRSAWLLNPAPFMCFRVAVRQVEAWLLADRDGIASFLSVGRDLIPGDPESLRNPKEALVNLARRSRRRVIREDMVPPPGSGRIVGPAYSSRLMEFASHHWRPDIAATRANSLARTVECLKRLTKASQS